MVGLNLVASGKRPQLPGCAIILPAEALHNGIVIRKPCNSVTKIALTYRTTRKSRIGDTTLGSLEDDLSPAATEAGHLYVGYAAAREPISDTPLSAPFGRAQQGSDGRKTCAADEHDMRIDELEEFDFETADGDDPAGDETEAGSEALTDEDAWDKEARRRGDEFLADCGDTFLADQADDAGEDAPVRPATKRKLLEPGWLRVAPETICAFDPTAAEARFLSRVFRSDVQKHERASLKAALTGAPAFLTAAVFNKLIVNNLRPYAVAQALGISPHSVKKHLCRAIERMAEYEARPPVARAWRLISSLLPASSGMHLPSAQPYHGGRRACNCQSAPD
jgi:hypothetical protein